MQDCVFCKILRGELASEVIAETDDIIVIKDINPKAPIHFLIIPRKHMNDIQSMAHVDFFYGSKIFAMAYHLSKTIPNAQDFNLHVNSGKTAGQIVMHLHVHFIAGKLEGAL